MIPDSSTNFFRSTGPVAEKDAHLVEISSSHNNGARRAVFPIHDISLHPRVVLLYLISISSRLKTSYHYIYSTMRNLGKSTSHKVGLGIFTVRRNWRDLVSEQHRIGGFSNWQ